METQNGGVVVVGSAGALGGAVLKRLVEDQREPLAWITYRQDGAPADAIAASIPGVRATRCDLLQRRDIADLASEVGAAAGHVRVLVHAAVDIQLGPLLEVRHETVSDVVASGGLSLLALVEEFDELLRPGSVILYMTSIGSHRVIQGYGAVGAAKAVGDALVRYLASELAPRDVRVNAMSLGPFASKAAANVVADVEALMQVTDAATPRGRRLKLAEVAEVAAFLAGPGGSGITGQVITVDAGIFNRWAL